MVANGTSLTLSDVGYSVAVEGEADVKFFR
jgi:hypothetical protein